MRRVLDASRELLAEGGFDAIQLASVSKLSGVSTGSLYHHFGSKAGIITQLVEEFTGAAVDALADIELEGKPFEIRLKALLDLTCAQFRNNPAFYQSMAQRVQSDPSIWQPLRDLRVKFEDRMQSELSEDLRQFGISDPSLAIQRMVQSVLGILTHSILFDSGPIKTTNPNLEHEVFAIGHAVLLLKDPEETSNVA